MRKPLTDSATALLVSAPLLLSVLPAWSGDFVAHVLHSESADAASLDSTLARLAPAANSRVLGLAASAMNCADPQAKRLAVIDFSLPSTEPRLWVFDLTRSELMFEELVSHGQGSGEAMAETFSNTPESHQSSLGLFRTLNSYYGRNGYSLRLEGLEEGINDLAYQRAIVIHGADYVSESFIEKTGRLGRSQGCPAVRPEVTYPLIDSIKENHYLFAYYPDADWLESSAFLACDRDSRQLAMNLARQ